MKKAGLIIATMMMSLGVVRAHELTPQQKTQLKSVFPEATSFSEKHVKLTDSQIALLAKKLQSKLGPKDRNVTLYMAQGASESLGNAIYFPAKDEDGDPIQGVIGLGMDGKVKKVMIFSHHKDYSVAQETFLGQFGGKTANPEDWHAGHTVTLVQGQESNSTAAMKAIKKAVMLAEMAKSSAGKAEKIQESGSKEMHEKSGHHDHHEHEETK